MMTQHPFSVSRYELVMLDPRNLLWRMFQFFPSAYSEDEGRKPDPDFPYWRIVKRVMRALTRKVTAVATPVESGPTQEKITSKIIGKPTDGLHQAFLEYLAFVAKIEGIPPPKLEGGDLHWRDARHVLSACPVLGQWDLWGVLSGLYEPLHAGTRELQQQQRARMREGWLPFILKAPPSKDYLESPQSLYDDSWITFPAGSDKLEWTKFFDLCRRPNGKEERLYFLYGPLFDDMRLYTAGTSSNELVESFHSSVMGWPFFFQAYLNVPGTNPSSLGSAVRELHLEWEKTWAPHMYAFRRDFVSLMAAIVEGRFRYWALRTLNERGGTGRMDATLMMELLPFLVPLRSASCGSEYRQYVPETYDDPPSRENPEWLREFAMLWEGWRKVDQAAHIDGQVITVDGFGAAPLTLRLADWAVAQGSGVSPDNSAPVIPILEAQVELGVEWLKALSREVGYRRRLLSELLPAAKMTKLVEDFRIQMAQLFSPSEIATAMTSEQQQAILLLPHPVPEEFVAIDAGEHSYPLSQFTPDQRDSLVTSIRDSIMENTYIAFMSLHFGSGSPIHALSHVGPRHPEPERFAHAFLQDVKRHRDRVPRGQHEEKLLDALERFYAGVVRPGGVVTDPSKHLEGLYSTHIKPIRDEAMIGTSLLEVRDSLLRALREAISTPTDRVAKLMDQNGLERTLMSTHSISSSHVCVCGTQADPDTCTLECTRSRIMRIAISYKQGVRFWGIGRQLLDAIATNTLKHALQDLVDRKPERDAKLAFVTSKSVFPEHVARLSFLGMTEKPPDPLTEVALLSPLGVKAGWEVDSEGRPVFEIRCRVSPEVAAPSK